MAHSLTAARQSCLQMGRCGRHSLCTARAAHTGRTGLWPWKERCLRLQRRVLTGHKWLVIAERHADSCVVANE
jgi:hypothetical protein